MGDGTVWLCLSSESEELGARVQKTAKKTPPNRKILQEAVT